jgi:hypothetical protein
MRKNDHVLVWDTEELQVKEGWIRFLVSNTNDREEIYFISYSEKNYQGEVTEEAFTTNYILDKEQSIISRKRFICLYDKDIEKKAEKYFQKYTKSRLIKNHVDINEQILSNVFQKKLTKGYFYIFYEDVKTILVLILTWIISVFFKASFWLVMGIILRPYIAFHNKMKLENKLQKIKKDYHRDKMIERLLKKENTENSIDSQIKIIETELNENKQEILDSTNSTIAIIISLISIVISIIALKKDS